MKRTVTMLGIVLYIWSYQTSYAQCLRTYKISFIDPQSKEPFSVTDNAYLKTGYQLWQETGNELYKNYGWKGVYICIYRSNKNPLISLVKIGKGSELIYCGINPCSVNCDMFGSFTAKDLAGTKAYYKLLSY